MVSLSITNTNLNFTSVRLSIRLKLFVAVLFCGTIALAQNGTTDSTTYRISAQYHHGIVIPHHTSMAYLIDDYSRGAEIKLSKRRFDSNGWQQYFNYPETGIALFYNTFGSNSIYGCGIALYPYINYRIIETSTVSLKYKLGLGLGYATKPFDIETNPYNTVFGSHLNAYVGFGLDLDMKIAKNWSVNVGWGLNHLSNGATKKPNNGINTTTFTIGTSYYINPINPTSLPKLKAPNYTHREWLVTAGIGSNQVADFNPNRQLSGSVSLAHIWSTRQTNGFGLGVDGIVYGGAPFNDPDFDVANSPESYNFSDYLYSSVFAIYHVQMDRTTLFFHLGAYIYQKTPPRQPIYPRLGIRYRLTDNLLAHFGIKANFFSSEFLEFGLGYRIPVKKTEQ
jgi:hypothetical protein